MERSVTLYYTEGSSDKVYQATLKPDAKMGGHPYWVVDFAYGRRGSTLATGTKTNGPTGYEAALRIYEKLLSDKKSKGYTEAESGELYQHTDKEQRKTDFVPQLLNSVEESEVEALIKDPEYVMQEKLDGRRIMLKKEGDVITGINRLGLTVGLPVAIVESAQAFQDDFVLDGECVGEVYHVFDILELRMKETKYDLTQKSYLDRYAALEALLGITLELPIRIVPVAVARAEKRTMLKRLREDKAEGVVFKLGSAPYTPGRPHSGGPQLKFKFVATASFFVMNITKGKRSVGLGVLDGDKEVAVGKVTVPANQEIPAVGEIVEIRYLYCYPMPDGALFQVPRIAKV